MRSRLHAKWRNQLRKAEAAGLHLSHGPLPADPHHPLLIAETAQARARQYANWPSALTAAFAAVAPDQTRLFSARLRGRVIAQMLFLCHGAQATYHIGHTTDLGRRHHAHNLLLWHAACWLDSRGYTEIDLGPLCSATPSLSRFKTRAGAIPTPTGGTWLRWSPLARSAPS